MNATNMQDQETNSFIFMKEVRLPFCTTKFA